MARYLFNLPPVQPTQTVRLDTASGSDSPATDVTMPDGTAVSAMLLSDHLGVLPAVFSGSATLYLKVLANGVVSGSPRTLTGSNQSPSAPGGSGVVESVVAGTGISVDATDPANPVVSATGGGSGAFALRKFPFAHNTADLAVGATVYTPDINDEILDAWVEIDTAFDGTTPKVDIGGVQPLGSVNGAGWYALAATGAIDATVADDDGTVFPGLLLNPNATAKQRTIQQAIAAFGVNAERYFPAKVTVANPIKVVVSTTGASAAVFATGGSDPALPLTVTAGVNDEFVYTPIATGTPETFTVAPGVYTTVQQAATATAAAIGSASGEAFSTLVAVSVDGESPPRLALTVVGATSPASVGDTITLGANDVAADLGFPDNPDTFVSNGDDATPTQGSGFVYLITATPSMPA